MVVRTVRWVSSSSRLVVDCESRIDDIEAMIDVRSRTPAPTLHLPTEVSHRLV
jgi:hypothetical protein